MGQAWWWWLGSRGTWCLSGVSAPRVLGGAWLGELASVRWLDEWAYGASDGPTGAR